LGELSIDDASMWMTFPHEDCTKEKQKVSEMEQKKKNNSSSGITGFRENKNQSN
jgi:hypothetical protein